MKIEFEKNIKPNQLVFSHTHHTQKSHKQLTYHAQATHTTYKQHTQVTHTPQTSNSYKSHTSNTHKQHTHHTTANHYLSTLHRELKNQFHILSKKKNNGNCLRFVRLALTKTENQCLSWNTILTTTIHPLCLSICLSLRLPLTKASQICRSGYSQIMENWCVS